MYRIPQRRWSEDAEKTHFTQPLKKEHRLSLTPSLARGICRSTENRTRTNRSREVSRETSKLSTLTKKRLQERPARKDGTLAQINMCLPFPTSHVNIAITRRTRVTNDRWLEPNAQPSLQQNSILDRYLQHRASHRVDRNGCRPVHVVEPKRKKADTGRRRP